MEDGGFGDGVVVEVTGGGVVCGVGVGASGAVLESALGGTTTTGGAGGT